MTTIVLALRLLVRLKRRGQGADDYLMMVGYVRLQANGVWFLITDYEQAVWFGAVIVTTLYANKGGTRHIEYLTDAEIPNVMKLAFIAQAFGIFSPVFGKLSVAALMVRILGRSLKKWQLISFYIFLAVYTVLNVLTCIFTFVQCKPTAALWDPAIPNAKCWPSSVFIDVGTVTSCK